MDEGPLLLVPAEELATAANKIEFHRLPPHTPMTCKLQNIQSPQLISVNFNESSNKIQQPELIARHCSRESAAAFHTRLVRKGGLEPPRLAALEPKSRASTNSATFALIQSLAIRLIRAKKRPDIPGVFKMVGRQGFEPWTY